MFLRSVAFLVLCVGTGFAGGEEYQRRWFYTQMNLQVAENADRLIDLIGRAKAAGYNGVVLADYKLNILDRVPQHYFANIARVRQAAEQAGIEIIPAVFPIGYSNGLLAHDPNLAEGLPVIGAPFVVRRGEAQLVPDPETRIVNGGFEEVKGDRFAGFSSQDGPGQFTFADREVVHQGQVSCRIEVVADGGNRRVIQRVKVRPWACYRLSAWVKTKDLKGTGAFRLLAIGAGKDSRPLTFFEGGIQASQDWKRVEVVFNSLGNDAVNLYAGLWGGGPGTVWLDEFALEELAFVNILRREGCPLSVASEDGQTLYEEGKDFEPLTDPKLGRVPYAGEYGLDHLGPALRLTSGSRIRDGQRLRVGWYHPVVTHGSQVMCCPSEPKVYEILRDQVRRANELLQAKTFFMSHDEIRVANWCRACQSRGLTPGELLADNARRCVAMVEELNPEADVVVWSDMFDPHHNARDGYYLVHGTLEGSWEGLPKSVTIANWNGGAKRKSLEFFADRGHKQVIAGYYDSGNLSGFLGWDEAARDVPGVDGFMYTTWRRDYGLLEKYGQAMRRETRRKD